MKDVVDLHSHTIASGHAYNTIMEMAAAAAEKGLEMYGITEHAPGIPGTCCESYFVNLRAIERSAFPFELLMGAELNILDFDGRVDLKNGLLRRMDVTIASFHMPTMRKGEKEDYTRAAVKAMENPLINILGHPDDGRFPVDYDAVVTAAKETRTLLELNNSSLSPDAFRVNARENDIRMLQLCREKNVPIIMGSDAHFYTSVGAHEYAEALIEEADFPKELVMNYFPEKLKLFLNQYRK